MEYDIVDMDKEASLGEVVLVMMDEASEIHLDWRNRASEYVMRIASGFWHD
jgi:hypothetical protein